MIDFVLTVGFCGSEHVLKVVLLFYTRGMRREGKVCFRAVL